MSRARIYRPGRIIKDWKQFCNQIDSGNYIWWDDRPCHPAWLISMQYNVLRYLLRRGVFRYARKNEGSK